MESTFGMKKASNVQLASNRISLQPQLLHPSTLQQNSSVRRQVTHYRIEQETINREKQKDGIFVDSCENGEHPTAHGQIPPQILFGNWIFNGFQNGW